MDLNWWSTRLYPVHGCKDLSSSMLTLSQISLLSRVMGDTSVKLKVHRLGRLNSATWNISLKKRQKFYVMLWASTSFSGIEFLSDWCCCILFIEVGFFSTVSCWQILRDFFVSSPMSPHWTNHSIAENCQPSTCGSMEVHLHSSCNCSSSLRPFLPTL